NGTTGRGGARADRDDDDDDYDYGSSRSIPRLRGTGRRHRRRGRHHRRKRALEGTTVVSESYMAEHPWYPNHDLLTCVNDGDPPSYMTHEGGYAESHLFATSGYHAPGEGGGGEEGGMDVEGDTTTTEEEYVFSTSSCGNTLDEAQSCTALCLSGYGCPNGQMCFAGVMCPSSQVADAMGPNASDYVLETIDPSDEIRENTALTSVCGVDYNDAERRCRSGDGTVDGDGNGDGGLSLGTFGFADDFVACPSGMNGDCPEGEICYGGILCPIPETTTTTTIAAMDDEPMITVEATTTDAVGDEQIMPANAESEPLADGAVVRGDKTEVVGSSVVHSTPRPPVDDAPAAAPTIPSSPSNASPYTIDVSTLGATASSVAADSCTGGCPEGSTCVGSSTGGQLVVDADCAACETGQTWWPCDIDGACWCWTDGTERIAAAPGSGLDNEMAEENPNYTVCDDILTRDTFAAIAPDAREPYTYEGLCDAMLLYNARHDEKVFGMGNAYQRAAELASFLGNVLHESDELRAAREYLMCGDNIVVDGEVYCKPCDAGSFDWDHKVCSHGLVSGMSEFNEYCQPTSKPPEACQCGNGVGESGELEGYIAAKHLFFGRGSIQLTWNYNYIGASIALTGSPDTFCDDPDLIATEGRYAWGVGIYFWMEHSKEGTTCHMEALTDGGDFGGTLNNINGGLECPAHGGWHVDAVKARLNRYCRAAKALGLPNTMSLDKCSGLQDSLNTCLSEGTCEDCQHFVGSTPGSIYPDFVPIAPARATATTTTASDEPAETELHLCPEGMMPWEENPDCCVPNTNFIGDGACDPDAPYNIEACGYDGGDCCKETCNEDSAFGCTLKESDELKEYGPFGFFCIDPSQGEAAISTALCETDEKYRIGDGRCDVMFNTAECNYDGGDCCEDSCDDVHAFYPCGSGVDYICLDPPIATTSSSTNATPIACKTTLKECPGGEFVGQDHANNCKYFPCPKVTNDQLSQSSLASSFASSYSPTKQSKTQTSSFVSSDQKDVNSTQTVDSPSSIAAQITTLKQCSKDLLECSDGTFVERNPNNNCKFLACPLVTEKEPAESIAASIGSTTTKEDSTESIASSISSTTAKVEPAKTFPVSTSSTAAKVSMFPVVGHHGHCTDELKRCLDGSFVARDPNNKCEFIECPTDEPGSIEALSGQSSTTGEAMDNGSTNMIVMEDSVHEKDRQMDDCSQALFQCEDGHYVRQDPNNECNWYPCNLPRSPEQPAAHLDVLQCETDLFICPDGSFVERDFDNGCKFFECPNDDTVKMAPQSLHEKDSFGG
ncbi:hypothetical protein ACHAXA_000286, partial [Cyclostephanos tholiformis]